MRFALLLRVAAMVIISGTIAGRLTACQCGSFHDRNAWEEAKLHSESATTIFEGTPVRFEMRWILLSAGSGELVPANNGGYDEVGKNQLRMVVTFRVQKAYKGNLKPEVQIATGLGGGDCGAQFSTGLTYLVYTSESPGGELAVSMCSPGGWIGRPGLEADLRYLRKERPISTDLQSPRRMDPMAWQEEWQREAEEFQRRFARVTGKICGTVIRVSPQGNDAPWAAVSFLSTLGYSPVQHPIAQLNKDGSFCSDPLGPGKYYVFFVDTSHGARTSAIYYPGVSELSKALPVEVTAGRTQSNITFKAPEQKTYTVRGFISVDDKAELHDREVSVTLVPVDGLDRLLWYSQPITFQGFFPLPKTRYFHFDHVLPGEYIAYASVLGKGWLTRKVVITVGAQSKFISLLLRKR